MMDMPQRNSLSCFFPFFVSGMESVGHAYGSPRTRKSGCLGAMQRCRPAADSLPVD